MRKAAFLLVIPLVALACRQEAPAPDASTAAGAQPASSQTASAENGSQQTAPAREVAVGNAFPAFEVKTLDGRKVSVEPVAGKVVLLNLWATWCGPCRAETPELVELQKQYSPKGLEIVGVSVDGEGMQEDIKAFAAEYGVNYTMLHDPEGKSLNVFQTSALPTSALIDRTGRIVWIGLGMVRPAEPRFAAALQQALGS